MDLHEHFLNNQEEAEAIANHNRLLLEHENREQKRILKYRGQMEKKVYGTTYSLEATVFLTKSH